MTVRSSMAALISRVRTLINDPAGVSQTFDDQTIQDVLDASRVDVKNESMIPQPTFTGSTIQYVDYYTRIGDWEDDYVIKQYLVNPVTPLISEPIAGHWQFATTTLPPLYISGKRYDLYCASADLLERWAAKVVLAYSVTVAGQNLQRGQMADALQKLAKTYRLQQRPRSIELTRSDLGNPSVMIGNGLGPTPLDYFADGKGA